MSSLNSSNGPIVSICIPTFNGEKYLWQSLNSIKHQTYKNIEVIISDDNSKDKTLKIIQDFKSDVDFPVFIYNHIPIGIGANWNNCVEKAKGEYIKFLFQDDLLEPDCIEVMLNYLMKNNLEIVCCKRNIIDENGITVSSGQWFQKYGDLQSEMEIHVNQFMIIDKSIFKSLDFKKYNCYNFIGEPIVALFSKKLYKKIGKFNEKSKQILDYEYWLRTLKKYSIGIIEKKLTSFRLHPAQATFINSSLKLNDESFLLNNIFLRKYFLIIPWRHKLSILKLVASYEYNTNNLSST